MGIKDFFGKVWNGVKHAGRWVGDKLKQGVSLVGRIAQPILGGISMLPGKIGMIGKIGSGVIGGINGIIDQLPEGNMKEKVRGWVDTGQNKFKQGVDKAGEIADTVNRVVDKGKTVFGTYPPPPANINDVAQGIKQLINLKPQ